MQAESFDYRPSRTLLFLLVFIHLGTLIIISLGPLSLWIKFFGIFSFACNIKLQRATQRIFWSKKGGWKIQDRKGSIYSVKLKKQNICTGWVVGLNFMDKPLIIFFDSMSGDAFRRLRVLLINGG
jgi:hypothetical protein